MEEKNRKPKTKKKVRESEHEPERGIAHEQGVAKDENSMTDILERVLPVVSLILAFAAVIVFYRRFMPQPKQVDAAETMLAQGQQTSSSANQDGYTGLEDSWLSDENFTTGNADLDYQVKAFCDALSYEDLSAAENAQNVFDTIVWSSLEDRSEDEKPTGDEWTIVSAKHYFSSGIPEEGVGGTGDEYEFSAVASYCLQYFGFKDAWAIPILRDSAGSGQTGGAVVLVTNEDGQKCLCDSRYGSEGWMLDFESHPITVEDIGQDLTRAEDMGLSVKMAPSIDVTETARSSSSSGDSASDSTDYAANDTANESADTSQSSYDYSEGYGDYSEYSDNSSGYSGDSSSYDDTYGYY